MGYGLWVIDRKERGVRQDLWILASLKFTSLLWGDLYILGVWEIGRLVY